MSKFKATVSAKANQAVTTVGNVVNEVRTHWSTPAGGKHISYKEMKNYSIGGVGYMLVGLLTGYLALGATNTFLGSVVGLQPLHLYYMSIVMSIVSIFFTLIRGKIVDNTQTRWGRFRPYIALMGIPVVVLSIAFIFILSNEGMPYIIKLGVCMGFSLVSGFISPLFTDTFSELKSVMSPNSEERTLLITVHMLVASAAPSLTNLFVPILTNLTGGYTNAATYKWIIVPIGILGLGLTFFAAFGCKERLVVAKEYKPKVRVFKGIGEIYRNKYWWIRSIHGWAGFMEAGIVAVFNWLFIYGIQDMAMFGIMQTVNGMAAGICMVITPLVARKFGYRTILIAVNIANIFLISLAALSFRVIWLFFIFNWLNLFMGAFYYIIDPAMHCDVKDYQQYISGQRMDFMFGSAGIIGIPITILTGLFLPALYESFGLTTNYNALYDPTIRNSMFNVLCWTSALGAFINLVPLFFYNFSDEKHKNIIKVLKVRRLFGDYASGDLTPRVIKDSIEEVRSAYEIAAMEKPDPKATLAEYKAMRKAGSTVSPAEKPAYKAAKKAKLKEYFAAKEQLDTIESAHIVLVEMNKFNTPLWMHKAAMSQWITELSFDGIRALSDTVLTSFDIPYITQESKTLLTAPKGTLHTKEELAIIKYTRKTLQKLLRMQKRMDKVYPTGIVAPDMDAYAALRALPEGNRTEIKNKFVALKKFEGEMNRYNAVAEAYVEAQNLLKQRASYLAYPEIELMYEEASATVIEEDRIAAEKEAAAKEAKRAEAERQREARFQTFSPAKQARVLARRKKREEKRAERAALLASEKEQNKEDNADEE